MIIVLDQYTPTEDFINILTKSFNKQLELKSTIVQKIISTRGGGAAFLD